jgi:hypothetical protein
MLLAELKKIELRKKEREKKTQDLQKLITAADNQAEARKLDKKAQKKKVPTQQARPKPEAVVRKKIYKDLVSSSIIIMKISDQVFVCQKIG